MNKYCKIQGSNKIYIVESIEKEIVRARSNNLLLCININDVIFVDEIKIKENKKNMLKNYTTEIRSQNIPNEIMLRHLTKDIAISILDKYIDQAVVARLPLVRIIHGKQGGVLREAVHEYLKNSKQVKSYRLAYYNDGGIGVTVALLN